MTDTTQNRSAPSLYREPLDGKYRLEELLGQGGFALVYAARHAEVQTLRYAVKVLRAEHASTPEIVARFRREVSAAATLHSRHTVRVLDFGTTPDQLPYIVMELVRGTLLRELIHGPTPMRPSDVCRIAMGVLRALEEAHSHGILHRDLKPSNIFVVAEPGVRHPYAKVLDFGIAKILGGNSPLTAGSTAATLGGTGPCTPEYAAPELLNGAPSLQSDIYALGHVMIEMLEARAPYFRDDMNPILTAAEHLRPDPVPMGTRASASALAPVIRRAIEKDTNVRYRSVTQMLADLERVYNASGWEAEEPLVVQPTPPRPSGRFPSTQPPGYPSTPTVQSVSGIALPVRPSSSDSGLRVRTPDRGARNIALGALGVAALGVLGLVAWQTLTAPDELLPSGSSGRPTPVLQSPMSNHLPNEFAEHQALANVIAQQAASLQEARRVVLRATEILPSNTVRLRSTTPGVVAWLGDHRLGELPLEGAFVPEERPAQLRFLAQGYDELVMQFSAEGPLEADVVLLPKGTTPRAPDRAPATP